MFLSSSRRSQQVRGREADGAILAESERRSYRYIGYIFIHCPDPQSVPASWRLGGNRSHAGRRGLGRRANGKWKWTWKMEIVGNGNGNGNRGVGCLGPLSSPKRPAPLPPSRNKRNEKTKGRREDGRTGSPRVPEGGCNANQETQERIGEGGRLPRKAGHRSRLLSVCLPVRFSRWTIAWIPSTGRASVAGFPYLVPFSATTVGRSGFGFGPLVLSLPAHS